MPGAQRTQTVRGSSEKHSLRDKPGKENTSVFMSLGLRQSFICWHFPGVGSGRTTAHLRSQVLGSRLPFLARGVSPTGTEHSGFEELVVETWGRVLSHTEPPRSTDPAAHRQRRCSPHGAQGQDSLPRLPVRGRAAGRAQLKGFQPGHRGSGGEIQS